MPTVLTIVIVMLSASVVLGLFLGWQYLRRIPAKPVIIGVHLLLGLVAMKWLVLDLLWKTPEGTAMHSVGNAAALLLAAAMVSGLVTPLLAGPQQQRGGGFAQVLHAGVGLAGFALFLAWTVNL